MNDKKIIILTPELPKRLKGLAKEEEKIKLQSLTSLKSDSILDKRLTSYQDAMNSIYSLTIEHKNRNEDELVVQYIGIRLFNDLSVALKLMLSGYYQMSLAIQRDMIEVAFLLDYFRSYPIKIKEWRNSSDRERMNNFHPQVIRDALDKRDGLKNQRRAKKYKLFCEYAAHVSYPGNKLVAPGPGRLGKIGPFFYDKYLKACFFELIENALYSAFLFSSLFYGINDREILKIKVDLLKQMADWYQDRFNKKVSVDLSEIDKLLDILFKP